MLLALTLFLLLLVELGFTANKRITFNKNSPNELITKENLDAWIGKHELGIILFCQGGGGGK